MTTGKRRKQRQSTFDDVTPVYSAVRMVCSCREPNPVIMDGGKPYCRRCGRPFMISLESEWYRSLERLVTELSGAAITEPLTPEPLVLQTDDAVETDKSDDDSGKRIMELENLVSELRSKVEETIQQRDSEVGRLLSENKAMETRVNQLTSELADVDSTLRQRTRELKDMRSLDVRSAFADFLEFAAGINHTVTENDDLVAIREAIDIRTERLVKNLESHGITVHAHRRGDTLDNIPTDIIGVPTEDSSLDMKVMRSHRYGCDFRNDVYPYIQEEVSVYRYGSNDDSSRENENLESDSTSKEADE